MVAVVVVILVAVIDYITPAGMSFTAFYLLPILFASAFAGKRTGVFVAILCAAVWAVVDFKLQPSGLPFSITLWNLLSRMSVYAVVIILMSSIRDLNEQLETRVEQRTKALAAEVEARKQTESLLRISEKLFTQLTEGIREVLWMTNVEKTEMLYISPGYERIWGRTRDSLYASPRSWANAIHPEDRDRVLRAALTEQVGNQYDQEYRIVRPDGTLRWIHDRAFPILEKNENVHRIVGIAEDITERKQGEAKLATLAHAIESTSELICITDLDDRFTYVNRAFLVAYGYAEAEILGKTPEILFSQKSSSLMPEILEQTRAGGWRGEVLDQRKDGTDLPIRLSTSQIIDRTGQVIGLIGVAQDITERKRAEEALQQSEQRFRGAFMHTATGFALASPEGTFLQVNQALCHMLGYSEAELLGKGFEAITHRADMEISRQMIRSLLSGEFQNSQMEKRYMHKKGHAIWCLLTVSLMRDARRNPVNFIAQMMDISDRKRLEREIIDISDSEQRRIGQDLHDGLCQLLTGAAYSGKVLEQELSARASPEAKHAKELVSLLQRATLETRNIASGLYGVKLKTEGLPSALEDLAHSVRTLLNVACEFSSDRTIPIPDHETAMHLYRIAQEAVTNAVRHGGAKGITISLTRTDKTVTLAVEDNGRGFDAKRRNSKGMGLSTMKYRARMIGAVFDIGPSSQGGTVMKCSFKIA